jgi:hypothetical protein
MFNSKQITESFEASKEAFEDYMQTIKTISKDIEKLENILRKYGLHISFEFQCTEMREYIPEAEDSDNGSFGPQIFIRECIAWEINEKQKDGTYRIFYKKYHQDGNFQSIGPVVIEDSRIGVARLIERRPLIETPTKIRAKMHEFLSGFLLYLAREVSKLSKVDSKTQELIKRLEDALVEAGKN